MLHQLSTLRRRGHQNEETSYFIHNAVAGMQFTMSDNFLASVMRGITLVLARSIFTGSVRIELNFGLYLAVLRENGYVGRIFTPGNHTNTIIHPFSCDISEIKSVLAKILEHSNPSETAVRIVGEKVGSGYRFVGFYIGSVTIMQD